MGTATHASPLLRHPAQQETGSLRTRRGDLVYAGLSRIWPDSSASASSEVGRRSCGRSPPRSPSAAWAGDRAGPPARGNGPQILDATSPLMRRCLCGAAASSPIRRTSPARRRVARSPGSWGVVARRRQYRARECDRNSGKTCRNSQLRGCHLGRSVIIGSKHYPRACRLRRHGAAAIPPARSSPPRSAGTPPPRDQPRPTVFRWPAAR